MFSNIKYTDSQYIYLSTYCSVLDNFPERKQRKRDRSKSLIHIEDSLLYPCKLIPRLIPSKQSKDTRKQQSS